MADFFPSSSEPLFTPTPHPKIRDRQKSLTIHQDARVYLADVESGHEVSYDISPGHGIWFQVLRGVVEVDGSPLSAGDGLTVEDEPAFTVRAVESAEVLLFDVR